MKWEQPWPDRAPTLFDAFRAAGVEVASFVFDPGHLFARCPEAAVAGSSQDTEATLAWFRARPRGDYFAFVHYWWTHVPYVARALPLPRWNRLCDHVLARLSEPDPARRLEHRAQIRGLYELAVEEMSERWLPPLLDAARADVVVLVADHGESWGERLGPTEPLRDVFDLHGNHLHDEVLRVPLIVHAPGLVPPGLIPGVARTVDLAPTLVELLELPAPQGEVTLDGRSLVPALRDGRVGGDRIAVATRNRDFVDAPDVPEAPADVYLELAARDRAAKVVADFEGDGARRYDLGADPGELDPAPARAGRLV